MTVNFNENEQDTGAMAAGTNEQYLTPGGIIGFYLDYTQIACD